MIINQQCFSCFLNPHAFSASPHPYKSLDLNHITPQKPANTLDLSWPNCFQLHHCFSQWEESGDLQKNTYIVHFTEPSFILPLVKHSVIFWTSVYEKSLLFGHLALRILEACYVVVVQQFLLNLIHKCQSHNISKVLLFIIYILFIYLILYVRMLLAFIGS